MSKLTKIKQLILKYLPIDKFRHAYSYSQEGEDMVLRGFYEGKKRYRGFYIDVGAHHPYRFSNTMYFYQKGWRGINIEPSPHAMKWFQLFRKNDTNLNLGVSAQPQTLTYYCFNEPALNGFCQEVTRKRDGLHSRYHLIKTIPIPTLPLRDILKNNLPRDIHIDFMSVDAEGFDLIVLQSNDWERFRPQFVLVEEEIDFNALHASQIYRFMRAQEYKLIAKTKRTLFFKDSQN